MKHLSRRILALLLAISLLAVPAFAETVTEDGHIIRNPELLESFTFPNNWARPALEFCVGNGIMNGRNGDLAPNEKTTRAETAALIVRLLGAVSESPDLSTYIDANPDAWYYDELAAAVELGIMNGTSPTTLAPNSAVTREQVFTLLSRAFGLYPQDGDYWKRFSDGYSTSKYARNAVSALGERGILKGYNDGTIKPKQSITRAELAKLLYELFTAVCDTPEELPQQGRVLYRGSSPIPAGYSLEGDLTIGCGLAGEQTFTDLMVSGSLTLRPAGECIVTMADCGASALSLPGTMTVSGNMSVARLDIAGSGSRIGVAADICGVFADCILEAPVKNLICGTAGVHVELNAAVENARIDARDVVITGTGSIRNLEINSYGCDVQVAVENRIENPRNNPDNALETVQTLEVWDVVTKDTWLYSGRNLTGRIRHLPAGTLLDHFYAYPDEGVAVVYTEDGVYGWVDYDCIEIPTDAEIEEPYTTEVMEAFVNQKGYTSSTSYMIWVSLKTQTVNVFRGSKGAWTLEKSMPCASGKNSTPTIRGEFYIKSHTPEWDFGTYRVRYATIFYGGYAFHSRIWARDYSVLLDDTLGTPASDGCLRMLDEDCKYIYTQIPTGTRVVVH